MSSMLYLTFMSTTYNMQAISDVYPHQMTCKLALTRISSTEDAQAGSYTDVHNRARASWLLHECPQQLTCKLVFTQMSTTDDVHACSYTYVHNRGTGSWILQRCPKRMSCKLALTQICTQKMMFKLVNVLEL
ncbi:hypothetical protein DPMN_053859 [Dreissena polymorpha]|uniref:Uncharacterized protein n=1 Tax=Dreissena polymorpha TaxID=45954 RepID=A0A9D4CP86_DREPO|nr:hypothetical protein DPMN_053859 [Dreissena polymorpha]